MIQKNKKMIIFAVIAVIIVAAPLISYYGISQSPVPIAAQDGFSSFLWKGNFTNEQCNFSHLKGPFWLTPQNSIATISSKGFHNSSFYFRVSGWEWLSPIGPCVQLCVVSSGNLTPNLHPKDLVITESISAYRNGSPFITDARQDCSDFLMSPVRAVRSNLSVGQPSTSSSRIFGTGTTSCAFAFRNDTGLSKSTMFHFGVFPLKNTGSPNLSFSMINNNLHFIPQSYNITYHVYLSASLTGLSEPVYAGVELIIQYV
jgi:hypothetical protein